VPRASHWNTGMIFLAPKYSYGILSYGPVCSGTRDEQLSGENGKQFGNLVCKSMGFVEAEFLGLKSEYNKFMLNKTRHEMSVEERNWLNDTCTIPSLFQIII